MSERASVLQRTQVGPETVPGTPVVATKRLGATSIQVNPAGNINRFAPVGEKFDTLSAMGREWSTLALNGYGSYNDLAYLFSGLVRSVTPVQQGGSAAYLWTFTPRSSQEDPIRTFTVEQGEISEGGRALRAAYGLLTNLSLESTRDGVNVTGGGMSHRIEDDHPLSTAAAYTLTAGGSPPTAGNFTLTHSGNTTANIAYDATPAEVQAALEALASIGANNVEVEATTAAGAGDLSVAANVYTITFKRALAAQAVTLTGTFSGLTDPGTITLASSVTGAAPTLIAPVPILGDQVDMFVDDAHGSIGGTQVSRHMQCTWSYANRFNTVWPLDSRNPSFASHVEVKPAADFTLRASADDAGMGYLAAMRTGATKYIRYRATGAIIASTYPYQLTIDMACKVGNVISMSDQDGVYQVSVPLFMAEDSDLTYPFRIQLQNALASL